MRQRRQVGCLIFNDEMHLENRKTFTGDLSYQFYIKERQKCKPFSYFMEVVAPDMLDRYPYVEPPEFASGAIQSLADPNFCIDALNRPKDQPVGKYFSISNETNWLLGFIDSRTVLLCK